MSHDADRPKGKQLSLLGEDPDRTDGGEPKSALSAADFLPAEAQRGSLVLLREAAARCQGCPLHEQASQIVFGEGPADALGMIIGEQPGDREDQQGRPFVGPAGKLLDRALAVANLDRQGLYFTNAVKHFKWKPQGKRRLHQTPNAREIGACRPWLEAELAAVKPIIVICLGSTAAQALLGPKFLVSRRRGEIIETPWAPCVIATVHPAALLRIPEEDAKEIAFGHFVEDLRVAASALARLSRRSEPN